MDQDDVMWWFTDEQKKLLKEVTRFANDNIEEAEIYNAKKEVPWSLSKLFSILVKNIISFWL